MTGLKPGPGSGLFRVPAGQCGRLPGRRAAVFFLWACLSVTVVFFPSLIPQSSAAAETGALISSVFYGGQFSAGEALVLARAKVWLDGLERAADQLAGMAAVRLADLDSVERQALAARLGLVEVIPESLDPLGTLESAGAAASAERETFARPALKGEARAEATVRQADPAEVSRFLADTEPRERFEEIIVALRRIVPEALEWAERGHALRERAEAPASAGAFGKGGASGSPDELVAGRLALLASEVQACLLYADYLRNTREDTPQTRIAQEKSTREWERTLDWAGDVLLPLRLARAEILLRQDRPQAARRALQDLKAPASEPSPELKAWVQARSPAWSDAWRGVWGPHPTDVRLYTRGLRLRALSQLRSGQPALAEEDLDAALALAPDHVELLLARGAVRQVRESFGPMCEDYYRACVLGRCEGLAAAREHGRCAPAPAGE